MYKQLEYLITMSLYMTAQARFLTGKLLLVNN